MKFKVSLATKIAIVVWWGVWMALGIFFVVIDRPNWKSILILAAAISVWCGLNTAGLLLFEWLIRWGLGHHRSPVGSRPPNGIN